MSLSKRLLVVFYAAMLGTGVVSILVIYLIGMPLIRQMEEEDVRHRVDRVEAALMNQLAQLHIRAQDWAVRPEVLGSPAQAASPSGTAFDSHQLQSLGLGQVVMLEPSGEALWSGDATQRDDRALAQLWEKFQERFCYPMWGVIQLAGDFYLFALAQSGDCGAILLAQRFDSHFVEELKGVTGLAVHFAAESQPLERDRRVRRLSDDSIAGEFGVRDYLGRPVMRGLVDVDRPVYRQGIRTLFQVALGLLAVAALGAMVIHFYVRRTIFTRLLRLHRTVRRIAHGGNLMQRVCVDGSDELAQLATDFNAMVDVLEDSQQAMAQAKAEADSANRAKSLFLANISHEIRTPLSAILGYAELMESQAMSKEERQQYLSIIQRNGDSLLALINGVLDLSRIEAGEVGVNPTPVHVGLLMKELVLSHRLQARSKCLELHLEYLTPLPQTLMLDAHRLRQILTNLLGNALKFTDQGQVTLAVSWHEADHCLCCTVSDTGIGMAESEARQVFEAFYQADGSHTRRHGGAGLGLAIAAQLTHLLGGSLTLESTAGHGSHFHLTIPAGTLPDSRLIQPREAQDVILTSQQLPAIVLNGRVLVVDDNGVNRLLLQRILTAGGMTVVEAANGQAMLDILSQDDGFDLVMLDMQMPVLDGYDAVRQLRARGLEVPVLALTANALQSERQRCLEAGCTEFLAKPVRAGRLLTVCRHMLGQAQATRRTQEVIG